MPLHLLVTRFLANCNRLLLLKLLAEILIDVSQSTHALLLLIKVVLVLFIVLLKVCRLSFHLTKLILQLSTLHLRFFYSFLDLISLSQFVILQIFIALFLLSLSVFSLLPKLFYFPFVLNVFL